MTIPRCFRWWLIIFIVVVGVLALALWLDLRHIPPSFTIVNFSMPTSADTRRHNSHHIDMFVSLKVKNPNNVYSISYDYIVLTVYYAQGTLGKAKLPKFRPKTKEVNVPCHVQADVHRWEGVLKAISSSVGGKAELEVELRTGVRYRNLGFMSKQWKLRFRGQFYVGSDGKILGKKHVKLCKASSC